MAKWITVEGFLLTKQDAADLHWLITLALDHVTMNPRTKARIRTISTRIDRGILRR